MISNNEVQLLSLIISIFAGIIMGLLFDLYRTINLYSRPSKVFVQFMDLLFWLITAVVVFALLLRADFGELRIYTFFGMAFGIIIYLKLFTEYIIKLYRLLFYIVSKFIRLLIIFITLPFKILYNLIWTPLNAINKFLLNIGNRAGSFFYSKISKLNKNKKTK